MIFQLDNPLTSRRALIAALPAVGAALLLPEAAPAESHEVETDCARIFRLWTAQRDYLNGPAAEEMSEEAFGRAVDRLDTIAASILPMIAVTAEDFIIKIIILSDYGACALPCRSVWPELWHDAERLAGLHRSAGLPGH